MGSRTDKNSLVPVVVRGPWIAPATQTSSAGSATARLDDSSSAVGVDKEAYPFFFRAVFSGGDQNFVVVNSEDVSFMVFSADVEKVSKF